MNKQPKSASRPPLSDQARSVLWQIRNGEWSRRGYFHPAVIKRLLLDELAQENPDDPKLVRLT
ncbi:hypothetical protein, partial [Serratia marcescens]|uniref:hypothetical protein n=1 Tax=Serratia marcescens TaxID=615 RepID=UPI001954B57E